MKTKPTKHRLISDILIQKFPNEWNVVNTIIDDTLWLHRKLYMNPIVQFSINHNNQCFHTNSEMKRLHATLAKTENELMHFSKCLFEKLKSIGIESGSEIGRVQDESGLIFSLIYLGYTQVSHILEIKYLLDGPRFGFQRDTVFNEEQIKLRFNNKSMWWYEKGMPAFNVGSDYITQFSGRGEEIILSLNSESFLCVKTVPFDRSILKKVREMTFDVPSMGKGIVFPRQLAESIARNSIGEIKLKLNLIDGSYIIWSIQDAMFLKDSTALIIQKL